MNRAQPVTEIVAVAIKPKMPNTPITAEYLCAMLGSLEPPVLEEVWHFSKTPPDE